MGWFGVVWGVIIQGKIWSSCTMGQILLSGSLQGEFGGVWAVIVKSEKGGVIFLFWILKKCSGRS